MNLKWLCNALLDLLYPQDNCCAACGKPLIGQMERLLCGSCRSDLEQCRLPVQERRGRIPCITANASPFSYQGVARRLVHQLKYNDTHVSAILLGEAMAETCAGSSLFHCDLLVPIPLHALRQAQRGYNQSALLAHEIQAHIGIPTREGLLHRVRATARQVGKNVEERHLNMEGAFEGGCALSGEHVLLIDDVLTTGATASACARALLRSGAGSVSLLTACRD